MENMLLVIVKFGSKMTLVLLLVSWTLDYLSFYTMILSRKQLYEVYFDINWIYRKSVLGSLMSIMIIYEDLKESKIYQSLCVIKRRF